VKGCTKSDRNKTLLVSAAESLLDKITDGTSDTLSDVRALQVSCPLYFFKDGSNRSFKMSSLISAALSAHIEDWRLNTQTRGLMRISPRQIATST